MIGLIELISSWSIPILLIIIPTVGIIRRIPVYESFITGAKDGFATAMRIIPYLVAMFIAIKVFQNSGAMSALVALLSPLTSCLNIPNEILPLGLIRPLSGSGALGMLASMLNTHGPDSLIGRLASTVQGSTETTFYVLTVYLGAVGIRKIRYALFSSLAADIAGFLTAIYIVHYVFG